MAMASSVQQTNLRHVQKQSHIPSTLQKPLALTGTSKTSSVTVAGSKSRATDKSGTGTGSRSSVRISDAVLEQQQLKSQSQSVVSRESQRTSEAGAEAEVEEEEEIEEVGEEETDEDYTDEEDESEDGEEEGSGRKRKGKKKPSLQFHNFLPPEFIQELKEALKPREYAKEALEPPPPPREIKYFDLHLPQNTKDKLKKHFPTRFINKLDKTPASIPFEVIPDSNVILPDVGAVRKGRRASTTTLKSISSRPQVEIDHLDEEGKVKNPFYYPKDIPAFMIHMEQERLKKRVADLEVPTKEKMHGVSLIQKIVTERVKPYLTEHAIVDQPAVYNKIVWEANHGLNITRLQKVARKIHANYINYRKMIFYQEYGIHARNEAIKQMREVEANEEMALKNYEYLSQYTQQSLDAFIRENEESANLAGKIAEEKMKTTLHLSQAVRELKLETSTMKTEISSLNESLRECKFYMKFLDGVARELLRGDEEEQFRKERRQEQVKADIAEYLKGGMTLKQAQKALREKNKEYNSDSIKTREMIETESGEFIKKLAEDAKAQAQRSPIASRINSILQIIANSAHGDKFNEEELFKELGVVGGSEAEDREELASLIFSKPSQLLNIYAELEEQNLSLIQHAQMSEAELESVEKKIQESRKSTESRARELRDKINEMEQQIMETASKISTLQLLIDMFTGGLYDVKTQEKMMKLLRLHVDKVYKSAVGVNDAHLDSVLMLTSIEKNFEELVRELNNMPPQVVTKISRDLEKERRETERQDSEHERKLLNDKRFARNLERTTGPSKLKRGRNLAFRSRPPKLAVSLTQKELDTKAEEEEWNYYFGE